MKEDTFSPETGSLVLVNMYCSENYSRVNQVGIVIREFDWNPYEGEDYDYRVRIQGHPIPCVESEVDRLPDPFLPSVCF